MVMVIRWWWWLTEMVAEEMGAYVPPSGGRS